MSNDLTFLFVSFLIHTKTAFPNTENRAIRNIHSGYTCLFQGANIQFETTFPNGKGMLKLTLLLTTSFFVQFHENSVACRERERG